MQSAYPTSVKTIIGKNTLATSAGKVHADMKVQILRCFSPEFFEQKFPEISHFLTDRIYDWCRSSQITIFSELHSMFLELASVSLVSMDMPKSEKTRIQTLYHEITDNLFTLPINLPGFGFHKVWPQNQTYLLFVHLFTYSKNEECFFSFLPASWKLFESNINHYF